MPVWGTDSMKGICGRLHKDFAEQPIPAPILGKLSAFREQFDNVDGRAELAKTGLSSAQIDAMFARTKWLIEGGRFPTTQTYDAPSAGRTGSGELAMWGRPELAARIAGDGDQPSLLAGRILQIPESVRISTGLDRYLLSRSSMPSEAVSLRVRHAETVSRLSELTPLREEALRRLLVIDRDGAIDPTRLELAEQILKLTPQERATSRIDALLDRGEDFGQLAAALDAFRPGQSDSLRGGIADGDRTGGNLAMWGHGEAPIAGYELPPGDFSPSPYFRTYSRDLMIDAFDRRAAEHIRGWQVSYESQRAQVDNYLKAEGDYNKLLRARARELRDVNKAIAEARVANGTTPLALAWQNLVKVYNQVGPQLVDRYKGNIASRARGLQGLLDSAGRRNREVAPKVVLANAYGESGGSAYYTFGTGHMTLFDVNVLGNKQGELLALFMNHENTHFEQDLLVIRHLTQTEIRPEPGRALTTEQMTRLQKRYNEATGFNLDPDFANQVLAKRPEPLPPGEHERAKLLLDSTAQWKNKPDTKDRNYYLGLQHEREAWYAHSRVREDWGRRAEMTEAPTSLPKKGSTADGAVTPVVRNGKFWWEGVESAPRASGDFAMWPSLGDAGKYQTGEIIKLVAERQPVVAMGFDEASQRRIVELNMAPKQRVLSDSEASGIELQQIHMRGSAIDGLMSDAEGRVYRVVDEAGRRTVTLVENRRLVPESNLDRLVVQDHDLVDPARLENDYMYRRLRYDGRPYIVGMELQYNGSEYAQVVATGNDGSAVIARGSMIGKRAEMVSGNRAELIPVLIPGESGSFYRVAGLPHIYMDDPTNPTVAGKLWWRPDLTYVEPNSLWVHAPKRGSESAVREGGAPKIRIAPMERTGLQPVLVEGTTAVNLIAGGPPIAIGRKHKDKFPLSGKSGVGDVHYDSISGDHALIQRAADGTVHIRDISRHGTFVNGVRLVPDRWTKLPPNANVQLGSASKANKYGLRLGDNSPVVDAPAPVKPTDVARPAPEAVALERPDGPFHLFPADQLDGRQKVYAQNKLKVETAWSEGNSGHDKYRGSVRLDDGRDLLVYLHNADRNERGAKNSLSRLRREIAAYQLGQLIEFTHPFPVTAVRDGMTLLKGEVSRRGWIQEDAGEKFDYAIRAAASKLLGSTSDRAVSQLVAETPALRSAIEEAFVERMVYGDSDDHAGNFTMTRTGDQWIVRNIDLDYGFPPDTTPSWLSMPQIQGSMGILHRDFSERPISAPVLAKLEKFLATHDGPDGRALLLQTGLTAEEVNGMMGRTRWLVENRQFPRALTFEDIAAKSKKGAADAGELAMWNRQQIEPQYRFGEPDVVTRALVSEQIRRAPAVEKLAVRPGTEKLTVRNADGLNVEMDVAVRVYEHAGKSVTVLESYAKELDQLRLLRKSVAENRPFGELSADLAREALEKHPLRNRVLPEEVMLALDDLPEPLLLEKIVMRGDDDPYSFDRYDPEGLGAGENGRVSGRGMELFKMNRDNLAEILPHEWAHALDNTQEHDGLMFRVAAKFDGDEFVTGKRARTDDREDFAVHMGEAMLAKDETKFLEFVEKSPMRAVALAMALKESITRGGDNNSEFRKDLLRRIEFVEREAGPKVAAKLEGTATEIAAILREFSAGDRDGTGYDRLKALVVKLKLDDYSLRNIGFPVINFIERASLLARPSGPDGGGERPSVVPLAAKPDSWQSRVVREASTRKNDSGDMIKPERTGSKSGETLLRDGTATGGDLAMWPQHLTTIKEIDGIDGTRVDEIQAKINKEYAKKDLPPDMADALKTLSEDTLTPDQANILLDAIERKLTDPDIPYDLKLARTNAEYRRELGELEQIKRNRHFQFDQDRLDELVLRIHEKFSDPPIDQSNFNGIFPDFINPADRALAAELMEQMGSNMNSRSLDTKLQALEKQLSQDGVLSGDRPLTIYVPDGLSPGNALAYLLRKNHPNMKIVIKTLDATTLDALKTGTPADGLVLDDPSSFNAEQKTALAKASNLAVANLGGFDKGLNIYDFGASQFVGNRLMKAKVTDLVAEARALQAKEVGLSDQEAVRRVLQGGNDIDVENAAKALNPNARVFSAESELANKNDRAKQSVDDKIKSIYNNLIEPLIDIDAIQGVLDGFNGTEQAAAAFMLLQGAEYYSYPRLMTEMRTLRAEIEKQLPPGKTMDDVVVVTGFDADGSSYMMQHMFGKANGLTQKNFVSLDDIRSGKAVVKGKTLVYLDDFSCSGKQTYDNITNNQSILRGARPDGVIVATVGNYKHKENPWNTMATDTKLKGMNVQLATTFAGHDFYAQENPVMFGTVPGSTPGGSPGLGWTFSPAVLQTVGGLAAWSKSKVRTSVITPYGGPNNNLKLLNDLLRRSRLPAK